MGNMKNATKCRYLETAKFILHNSALHLPAWDFSTNSKELIPFLPMFVTDKCCINFENFTKLCFSFLHMV